MVVIVGLMDGKFSAVGASVGSGIIVSKTVSVDSVSPNGSESNFLMMERPGLPLPTIRKAISQTQVFLPYRSMFPPPMNIGFSKLQRPNWLSARMTSRLR